MNQREPRRRYFNFFADNMEVVYKEKARAEAYDHTRADVTIKEKAVEFVEVINQNDE